MMMLISTIRFAARACMMLAKRGAIGAILALHERNLLPRSDQRVQMATANTAKNTAMRRIGPARRALARLVRGFNRPPLPLPCRRLRPGSGAVASRPRSP